MPLSMKIQPIDFNTPEETMRIDSVKPMAKSRLKRFFDFQFPSVLRNSTAAPEKVVAEEPHFQKDGFIGSAVVAPVVAAEFEHSSVCLDSMVQNFIEENNNNNSNNNNNNEKQSGAVRCGRNRCNCFNRNCIDSSSEDEWDSFGDSNYSSTEACEILKGLVPCATVCERNLLADTSKIVEKNKICKRKDEDCRKVVTDGLLALGYDASICKSRWEKCSSYPAGEYEYIDVIIEGERYLIDIDFRSEFEIARPTKSYKTIVQALPYIFVGKADRLRRIIAIASEAAKQSLKKKNLHIPPWRKAEYVNSKWLSPHARSQSVNEQPLHVNEFKLSQAAEETELGEGGENVFAFSEGSEEEEEAKAKEWKPPEIKPKPKNSLSHGVRIVTGLASVIEDSP
ncbi:uncharacterized protein LOC111998180 [Quercus suber]|uniref:Uncharacterized protein n=1 Tax=Quercus suber TaxID=58331 RepID=A0AAW0M9Y1_QUESU|nr:uncharacterized protein LOC111998180 [Quercus suber]POE68876.1 hypothetical protein CFP56_64976 [Quercus suber]